MQRYFIPAEQFQANQCRITGQDAHHINRVMRFSPGDRLICCDGRGRSVLAEIEESSAEQVTCNILEPLAYSRELPVRVSVAQGLPKGDKFEWVLQKGTELGADRFIPFSSARTIVSYEKKKAIKKKQRWEKIIKEAAEQAHRDVLPRLESINEITDLYSEEANIKLVAYEEAALDVHSGASSFVQALRKVKEGDHLLVVVGPEGGLAKEEVSKLEEHGFRSISLGKRVLRTETASQYALAAISFYFEQLGG